MKIVIEKNIFYNFFAFILLFLLVFDLKLLSSVGSAFITFSVCFSIIFINFNKYYSDLNIFFRNYALFFLIFLVMIIYVFLRFLFSSMDDYSYLLTTLKTTMVLLATTSYLMVFKDTNLSKNLFNVFFLNACICLFLGSLPEYKFLIYPFKYGDDPEISLIGSSEYRDAVLAGSSYFGVSALFGLAFALFLRISLIEKKAINYFKLIVIAISGLLLGRVALVCYLIALIYFFVIKKSIKVLIFLIFSIFIFLFVLNSFTVFESARIWFFEMFMGDGVGKSESASQLKEMIYLPKDQYSLIFGDARYGSSDSYYGGSDSGYIRNILFGGFVFLIILLLAFFSMFGRSLKDSFTWLIIILCLLLHFKGVFIFNNPGFFGVVLTICYISMNSKKVYK